MIIKSVKIIIKIIFGWSLLMKAFRNLTAILCLCIFTAPLFSESMLIESFSDYGIENIGIYTEAYKDLRSSNFLLEISSMDSNPMLRSPSFYRDQYCNFDKTTPPLTTFGYPLNGTTSGILDDSLDAGLKTFLQEKGWKSNIINDFTDGRLKDLLSQASETGFDAVLLVRYTPIHHFVPIENYNKDWLSGRTSATIGSLQVGIGYIPALELYDTKTGTRLWYSAYHTGHQTVSKREDFQVYVDKAEDFFIRLNTSDNEIRAKWAAFELSGEADIMFGQSDADEKAAQTMIELSMVDVEEPFPDATDSQNRSIAIRGSNQLRHLFWTDSPSYSLYGTEWGIGYTYDYIGNFNLYFRDDSYGSSKDDPSQIIASNGAMMHRLTLPFYSIAFGNLAIEPSFFGGYIPPYTDTVAWKNIDDDVDGVFIEKETLTGDAEISAWSVGFDLNLKYFFRITDRTSIFIGGNGTAQTYFPEVEEGIELSEEGKFRGHGEGLLFIDGPDLTITAAVIAGLRFDGQDPFEIFALYTPVGQAGKPMISAGIKWLPFTWGWIEPHNTHIAENLSIF